MTDTQGKLLVAPPGMPDWRFQKTVVYMWRHDVSGAAGVVINKNVLIRTSNIFVAKEV